jgi:DNA-binding transcriptional ArsR family regulator
MAAARYARHEMNAASHTIWMIGLIACRKSSTELARRIPVTRQAIAKHFAALEEAGLAAGIRAGRETRYELRTQAFAEAEAWMRAIGATWDRRLVAFKDYLESVPSGSTGRGKR